MIKVSKELREQMKIIIFNNINISNEQYKIN
jgi:hypothetical protein